MMRFVRIFFLSFQNVYQYRSQIFIWFLISLLHPLVYLLFWSGSVPLEGRGAGEQAMISAYYLLLIVAGGLLFVHVETDAYEDIQRGQLSLYLLKPFSYLKFKWVDELPWRLIQGAFGAVSLLVIFVFNRDVLAFSPGFERFGISVLSVVLGYTSMFLFKMIILLTALWVTDIGGVQQFVEMILIVFSGIIMPIDLFPEGLAQYVVLTPFPYMIYYPIQSFLTGTHTRELVRIIGIQMFWVFFLYGVYRIVWHFGNRRFSAVGQ